MTFLPPGGMYYVPNGGSSLERSLRQWLRRNPAWASRIDDIHVGWRQSTVEEVAEGLVQDPVVVQALGALTSPAGQAVEHAVLAQVMTPAQATLLTDALTMAWKTVRNQNLPVWKRADVLIGTVVVVILVGAVVYYARHRET